jgi:hypothetical protein
LLCIEERVASDDEEENFKNDFADFSEQIGAAWQQEVALTFSALDALAVDVTMATASSAWPFVTISELAIWETNARYMAPAISAIAMTPLVSSEQRADYENYTLNNAGWICESVQWQIDAKSYESAGGDRRKLE